MYFLICFLVILWFICTLIIRTAFLPNENMFIDPIGLRYARGDFDEKLYIDNKFQPTASIIETINQDIREHPDSPPIVYRVATYYKYMIISNNKIVLDDQLLDKFSFASQDGDYRKTMDRFKNTGIKYIVAAKGMSDIDKTPKKTLTTKEKNFVEFLNQNQDQLELMTNPRDPRIMIFRIK